MFWIIYYPQEHKRFNELCDIFSRMHTQIAMSPLHTPEPNEIDVREKKPHFHIIFSYSGPKTVSQMYSTLLAYDLISGCAGYKPDCTMDNMKNCIDIVEDKEAATRYLIHLDHLDRQQFSKGFEAIKVFSGYDLSKAMACNYSERFKIYSEIINYCKSTHCYWYHEIIDYCYENERLDWLNYLQNNSYPVQMYLTSYIKHIEYIQNKEVKQYQIDEYKRQAISVRKAAPIGIEPNGSGV